MRKTILFVAFILYVATPALAQGTCTRHVEASGGFSYCPPPGWVAKDSASGGPYKTFSTPPGSAVVGNMNVKEEATTSSHNDYLVAALKLLLADNPPTGTASRKIVGWTNFETASKLRGSRLTVEVAHSGRLLRLTQYVFDLPGKKLIITGTALDADKEAAARIFDEVMTSLRLGPR